MAFTSKNKELVFITFLTVYVPIDLILVPGSSSTGFEISFFKVVIFQSAVLTYSQVMGFNQLEQVNANRALLKNN